MCALAVSVLRECKQTGNNVVLRRCGGCRSYDVMLCSTECMKRFWRRKHRQTCARLGGMHGESSRISAGAGSTTASARGCEKNDQRALLVTDSSGGRSSGGRGCALRGPDRLPMDGGISGDGGVPLEVKAWADSDILRRPCVDCGRWTGAFCNLDCKASHRLPREEWAVGQCTPHCTACDSENKMCHFCRGHKWRRPPAWPTEFAERRD